MKELKVVIADDSESIRALLQHSLSRVEGLKIVGVAQNGAEATRMINDLTPDLVVLDISMPRKNGIEVLKEVRRDNSSSTIVMFTGDPSKDLQEVCLAQGANHYLNKFEFSALVNICQQQLLG